MVTFEEIQDLVREDQEDQFSPLTIVMDSGDRLSVLRREHLIAIRGWDIVFLQRPEDEKARLLDPGHIRELIRGVPLTV